MMFYRVVCSSSRSSAHTNLSNTRSGRAHTCYLNCCSLWRRDFDVPAQRGCRRWPLTLRDVPNHAITESVLLVQDFGVQVKRKFALGREISQVTQQRTMVLHEGTQWGVGVVSRQRQDRWRDCE
jgi:hypothetical protein